MSATITPAQHAELHGGITAANYVEALHPRGHDGKWIEKLGVIKLLDFKDKNLGDLSGKRGRVIDITPDPDNPDGPPDIKVGFGGTSESGPDVTVTVKPKNIEQAPEKARIEADQEYFGRGEKTGYIPEGKGPPPAVAREQARQAEQGRPVAVFETTDGSEKFTVNEHAQGAPGGFPDQKWTVTRSSDGRTIAYSRSREQADETARQWAKIKSPIPTGPVSDEEYADLDRRYGDLRSATDIEDLTDQQSEEFIRYQTAKAERESAPAAPEGGKGSGPSILTLDGDQVKPGQWAWMETTNEDTGDSAGQLSVYVLETRQDGMARVRSNSDGSEQWVDAAQVLTEPQDGPDPTTEAPDLQAVDEALEARRQAALAEWRAQNRRYSPPLAAQTPREVDAGNVYVGDEIMLPGDILATVTGIDMVPGSNDVMILQTTMGPRTMRLSDRVQVIPPARRAAGALDDAELLATWLGELAAVTPIIGSGILITLETEALHRGFDLPTAAIQLLAPRPR